MIIFKVGDIFDSECQTLVNTVNCVGIMGKGIALQFKKRYPKMFEEYKQICKPGQYRCLEHGGDLWLYLKKKRYYVLQLKNIGVIHQK